MAVRCRGEGATPYALECPGSGSRFQAAAPAPGPELLASSWVIKLVPGSAAHLGAAWKRGEQRPRRPLPLCGGPPEEGGS